MNKSRLKEVVIAVTYRCNSRCRMCSIWKISDYEGELALEKYKKLPEDLTDINITGGEPFLHKELPEIIRIISDRSPNANITISSNGFATELIADKMKQILEFASNIGVVISIDGVGKIHSRIRGIDQGFEKAMKTFQKLKEIGVKSLKFGFTIGDYNIGELKKVYNLAREKNVEFSLTLVHSSENYFGKENEILKQEEMIGTIDWLIEKELLMWNPRRWGRAYYAHGMKQFLLTGKRILPDYSGQLGIFIDPKGDIFPSDVSNKKMGNLKEIDQIDFKTKPSECEQSWMMCTARQSIKKHWIRVFWWIMVNKIRLHLRKLI